MRDLESRRTHWEKVFIFISSTFDDLHAERDYLVKHVFPELSEWCQKHKLHMVDVDLRWGVTEYDATRNRSVVSVCLDRIDECRPLFVCLIGQRYGWIPHAEDLGKQDLVRFPGLADAVSQQLSITELEILHVVSPFDASQPASSRQNAALFYLREPDYLQQLSSEPVYCRRIYTDEADYDIATRPFLVGKLQRLRDEIIPRTGRPVRRYQAKWVAERTSPELSISVQCSATLPANIERWRRKWRDTGGVEIVEGAVSVSGRELEKAQLFNGSVTRGRLADFTCDGDTLGNRILRDLQTEISTRFPGHDVAETDALRAELDQQEYFQFICNEGYVERPGDFSELDDYVGNDARGVFVLLGQAGAGKSSLLARWTERVQPRLANDASSSLQFRFIGASEGSSSVHALLRFLLQELREEHGKHTWQIPDDPAELRSAWLLLLEMAGRAGRTVIVLDGLNQLEDGSADLTWIPAELPRNVKLIVSLTTGDRAGEDLLHRLGRDGQPVLAEVRPFDELGDRRRLVESFLSRFLKALDEPHLEALIHAEGARNPLYLKIVLTELRVFGSYAGLGATIRDDFGLTPESAFAALLTRLERDAAYVPISLAEAVPAVFTLLVVARGGLTVPELADLLLMALGRRRSDRNRSDALETVHVLVRQVRPFLARRGDRIDCFFSSFKSAVLQRYVGDPGVTRTAPRSAEQWHVLLVDYLEGRGETYPRTLADLVFHLVGARDRTGLRRAFRRRILRKKRVAGFAPGDIQSDFQLAMRFFAEIDDPASLILTGTRYRSGPEDLHLLFHDSYSVLAGAIIAHESDRAEFQKLLRLVERQPEGRQRLLMIAELLVGLGSHEFADELRERYRRDLEHVLDVPAEDGLDILIHEALGDVHQAFEQVLFEPRAYPKMFVFHKRLMPEFQRLYRILKLVRRHRSHRLGPPVLESLIRAGEASDGFGPCEAAISSVGLLAASPAQITLLRQALSGRKVDTRTVCIACALARDAALLDRAMRARLGETLRQSEIHGSLGIVITEASGPAKELDRLEEVLFGLAWFRPRAERHRLLRDLVVRKSGGRGAERDLPSWRQRLLAAIIKSETGAVDETYLVALSELWARQCVESGGQDAWARMPLGRITSFLPNLVRRAVGGTREHIDAWIEFGQAFCCIGEWRMANREAHLTQARTGSRP